MSNRLVRVRDKSGREFTTGEQHAKNTGLSIVDKPAADTYGKALPTKTNPLRSTSGDPTRADLEKVARDAGLDQAAITAARTKADLTQAIEAANQTQEG